MYSDELIRKVWRRGRASGERTDDEWRQDECGAWMRRSQYGETNGEFGWKIERTSPGSASEPDNLRPFHVRNAYDIANQRAHCHVTADRTGLGATAHTEELRNREA
jgi:hypothetical protein